MRNAVLWLALTLQIEPAHGFDLQRCIRILRTTVLPYAIENYTGQRLRLKSESQTDTILHMEDRIGVGDRGGVYEVRNPGGPKLIAKIPHSVRFVRPVSVHPEAELEMKREVLTYKLLKNAWGKIQGDPDFPKDFAWNNGSMPVTPILNVFESRHGTIILKPLVKGQTLASLFQKHQGRLPPDMKKSIEHIYAATRAIANHVRTPIYENGSWKEGRPFLTDVNPENLVWVSDPQQMEILGLTRPSFVFYEITPLINRQPQYLDLR